MKKAILAIAMVLGASQAHAFTAPAWACSLSFKGAAKGLKVWWANTNLMVRELFFAQLQRVKLLSIQ
jgi:hypothetical protein